ncbi:N-formylglutamate amidohydrolase [Nafulsella turpanensis]|uniref:N-formylglutamate amidohydrolase n=1 Tax=Nafulsella turpanensis TaxID=1265690 RepID=UPI00034A49F0|nr:N-formylglutamate amidohydrolase [Nafulsella turpanensis]
MNDRFFEFSLDVNQGPILATAIHDGHQVRKELKDLFRLKDEERLREEDPYTGKIARAFPNHLVVNRSRFEVDLNRGEEKAVYQKPEDAWGLDVWKEPVSEEMIQQSLRHYHQFFEEVEGVVQQIIDAHGYAIVYDIHSYNHRRESPEKSAPKEGNPDIDILTEGIEMKVWRPVLDQLKHELQLYPYPDGPLDVREEVRFKGGGSNFMQRMLSRFGEKVFIPSIEFKKIFMDEWTGVVDEEKLGHLTKALQQTEKAVVQAAENRKKILASL